MTLLLQTFGYIVTGLEALGAVSLGDSVEVGNVGVFFGVTHLLLMIFMIYATLRVRRLKGLRNGRIAAGLACVPFVSPAIPFVYPTVYIGIPFGIWLFFALARRDVDTAFKEHYFL